MTADESARERNTRGTSPEDDHDEGLDPRCGVVLCTGCSTERGGCRCHAGVVRRRIKCCSSCRMPNTELADAAAAAAAAVKAGKPIPPVAPTEQGERAQRVLEGFDPDAAAAEVERRYR